MSTPVHEISGPAYPTTQATANAPRRPPPPHVGEGPSDNQTFVSGGSPELRGKHSNLSGGGGASQPQSRREENYRLEDDLELLRAERVVSRASEGMGDDLPRSKSGRRKSRSRITEPIDDFDISTNPVHDNGKGLWRPPERPATKLSKFFKAIHESSVLVRYFAYVIPLVLILLVPLLLGALVFKEAHVGGVYLMWFMVWLEVVWLSLWAGRIVAGGLPYVIAIISSAFTNNSKKWKDMGRMLEVPATLFLWWLAIYVSFLPTMTNHHNDGDNSTRYWESRVNIVLLTLFIAMILNLVEKIIIQLIAISFHLRTYEDRIDLNKFQICSLAKLYAYSKGVAKERNLDEKRDSGLISSGTRTPLVVLQQAKAGAQSAFTKVGDVMGKVAGDFTGRKISSSTSPQQVVLTLLYTTEGSQALARRLFRTLICDEVEVVYAEDLKHAFSSEDEAEAAFQMFDRDLNGDISCEEMEIACVEIGRERKAITASLKDLDSVVSKLDDFFMFIVIVIGVLVFLSMVSKSTAGVLTSASSSALALSWLFSASAQEFLASIIFVFVKHPFDVGDRVDIYNTGAGTVDTFFVKEIALMYTEFKKLEGHIVQAPNSLLNTLFILNMRRSGALAEAIPIVCKFGTSLEQIEELRERLLAFVKSENREYQGKIITELRDLPDMHSVKLNVVFFYKSNWQNELVRLQRRNKFMCALMVSVADVGIESPNMRWPGQKQTSPVFLQSVNTDQIQQSVLDRDGGPNKQDGEYKTFTPPTEHHGILGSESRGAVGSSTSHWSRKKVDFSLGVKDIASGDDSGDVFEDNHRKIPSIQLTRVLEEEEEERRNEARTTSRDSSVDRNTETGGAVNMRGSGSGNIVSHRNKFFGGRSHSNVDLEGGTAGSGAGLLPLAGRASNDGSVKDSIEVG